jgi:hypothetical protein
MQDGRVVDSGAPDQVRQRRPDIFAHAALDAAIEPRAA